MNRRLKRVIPLIFIIFVPFVLYSGEKMNDLAVLDIKAGQGIGKAVNLNLLTETVRGVAEERTNYRVMTRENVVAIMRDKGIDINKCTEAECDVEFGRILQADKLVVGELSYIDGVYYLMLKLYDVPTAAIDKVIRGDCAKCSFGALLKKVEESAKNLFSVLSETKPEVEEEKGVKGEEVPELKLACDVEKKFEACKKLYWYYTNTGSEERNKYFKALFELKKEDYFLKGCNEGNPESCFFLGRAYDLGMGAPKDSVKAVSLYKKACDMGVGLGCNNLGLMYNNGWGVPRDEKRAKELFDKACNLGYAEACK